jgi:hypothetical protein
MSSDVTTGANGAATTAAVPEDLSEASRQLLEQSFNEGNFGLIDQFVASEAVNHDPATPAQMRDLRGPEVLKRMATMYRAAFPDLRMTVDDVIAADDKVVLRWHSDGTHRGELAGLAPTGVHGSVTGMSIDRWKDGKVVEAWTGRQRRREDRNGSAAADGSLDAQEEPGLEVLSGLFETCLDVFGCHHGQKLDRGTHGHEERLCDRRNLRRLLQVEEDQAGPLPVDGREVSSLGLDLSHHTLKHLSERSVSDGTVPGLDVHLHLQQHPHCLSSQ